MYTVDELDTVTERSDVPQSSVGAPCPQISAGEHFLHLAYYLEKSEGEDCAVVRFVRPYAHMFGPPNDEALSAHPLARRGLKPYAAFEVRSSSWIRALEQMNAVHRFHRPEPFGRLKHYIFAFHDSVFECIAESFEVSTHHGEVADALRSKD